MNERLEKNIERYLLQEVKKAGGLTIKMGKNGNPDRLCMFEHGLSYLVETKSLKGSLSPKQKQVHKKIVAIDHTIYVLNSKLAVDEFIEKVKRDIKYIDRNFTTYMQFK